jgi:hypothetical protein
MAVNSKYQLSEGFQSRDGELAIPGTEIATGRAVVVHLLVAGDSSYNRQLVESLAQLPEQHKSEVIETGMQDGVPFVVTTSMAGNPSVKTWLISIQRKLQDKPTSVLKAAIPVPDAERTNIADVEPRTEPGEFTRFFSQSPSSGTPPSVPAPVPPGPVIEPAIDPLNETKAAGSERHEFTQFPSTRGDALTQATTPAQTPASAPTKGWTQKAAPQETTSPVVAWGTPITATGPRAVTGVPEAPIPVVPPPVSPPAQVSPASGLAEQAFEPGEFTRFLGHTAGEQPSASTSSTADIHVASWGKPLEPPVVPATVAPILPPVVPPIETPLALPLVAPAATTPEPGEFTRFFGGQSASPVQSALPVPTTPTAMPGGPSNRVVNKGAISPSSPPVALYLPQSPVSLEPPAGAATSGPGEFTRFFHEQPPGAPGVPTPPSAMPAALSDRVVNKGVPSLPATPLNLDTGPDAGQLRGDFEATLQGPVPGSLSAEELFWGKDAASAGLPNQPAYPAQGPGEFTKAMQSPLAAEPFRAPRVAPAKQPPGEFTRMMQGGGLQQEAPPPRPDPRPADPQAFPWKPSQPAGEYTRIFESAQPKEDQYSPAPVTPIHSGSTDLFGSNPAPRAAPLQAGPSDYTQMMNAGNAPKPVVAPPPAAPKTPESKPTPSKTSAKPLIVIAGILVVLAIVLLVVLLVRR